MQLDVAQKGFYKWLENQPLEDIKERIYSALRDDDWSEALAYFGKKENNYFSVNQELLELFSEQELRQMRTVLQEIRELYELSNKHYGFANIKLSENTFVLQNHGLKRLEEMINKTITKRVQEQRKQKTELVEKHYTEIKQLQTTDGSKKTHLICGRNVPMNSYCGRRILQEDIPTMGFMFPIEDVKQNKDAVQKYNLCKSCYASLMKLSDKI